MLESCGPRNFTSAALRLERGPDIAGSWGSEIRAVFAKELRTEFRSKSGLMTVLIFNLSAVIAGAFASANQLLTPGIASGFLWVTLLFSAVSSLARTFISEEEQGTGDLLRLISRPHAIFWGKSLYNLALMAVTALVLSALFLTLTGPYEVRFGLYSLCLFGGSLSLSGTVTFCGALVAQGSNRYVLASTLALPLLIPMLSVAIASTANALGSDAGPSPAGSILALWSYGLALFAVGPHLFAVVWRS